MLSADIESRDVPDMPDDPKADAEPDGPDAGHREDEEFLVIQAQVVVATIVTCCVECAWTERDAKYPGAQIAFLPPERLREGGCLFRMSALQRLLKSGATLESARRWLRWRRSAPKLDRP